MADAPVPSTESPTPSPAPPDRFMHFGDIAVELRKEAYTMALYVAICLLGALVALPTHQESDGVVIAIIWGVTVGLAMAHWFAFRVSATLVGDGKLRRHDLNLGSAQLVGAAVVALLASIPVLISPTSAELEAAELTLAAFIGVIGFAVARSGGANRLRAIFYATLVLGVAVAIALIKNALVGH
jgi:hypothetical protein